MRVLFHVQHLLGVGHLRRGELLTNAMARRGMDARPHGFRSSFRVWLAEATNAPHDVAETALGHVVGGSVERAYRRTDYLEQRRALMERWATHLVESSNKVVQL